MIRLSLELPLRDFSLSVEASLAVGTVAVMGRSGAGKSSLLEAIAGLRRARGRIEVDGEVWLDSAAGVDLRPERRRVGYVPQDARLFPHLTVEENAGFSPRATPAAVDEALSWLELAHLRARPVASLSGGERQRVAIARALASGPRLLLLDEPLAALDEGLKFRLLPWLLELRARSNVPLLYVTHQIAEARLLAAEALVLERGRLEASGPASEVLGPSLAQRLGAPGGCQSLLEGAQVSSPEGTFLETMGLRIAVPDGPSAPRALYALEGDEVLLAAGPLEGVSARNAFQGEVSRLEHLPSEVQVEISVSGARLWSRVTEEAAGELRLAAGRPMWVVFKAHAMKRLR